MNPTAPPPVAVIGLGRMGSGMAQCLLARGYSVAVWNRTPEAVAELAGQGATAAATPAAAAKDSELVLLSLADAAATREVLYGPDGVLSGGPLAGVLVSTSTLAPEEMALLAERTPAVLEVGLLGNHQHAAQGELRLLVGGDRALLDRVYDTLDLLAREVIYVGELGAGMRLKVLMNLLMGVQVQVLAEAVTLGEGLGLDRQLVLDTITGSGFASPVMNFKARRLSSQDYSAPDFRLRLMAKDLQLALAGADQVGLELPLAQAALRSHDTAVALGHGDLDCAAIAHAVAGPRRSRR
ncbi:NAD(P)-dependent oxidoreductase [Natronosporangium hydrolyticum]|uniref:NAD(P)-dependent oxidoreductase n=1 Tax=Natronosporangium hydrolyticum TaxID=2811111 RepID=A0A895YEP8_9ACTN|nr:NAD(P)-dependent oxidoreductase [Natronosporangium hydrolyticum]QSB16334.1 NAD(P)-dependent oxidoreductase [Natronosporangium hydrolyticum]